MKKFETPTLEIEELSVEDVITTSGGVDCANLDCPFD